MMIKGSILQADITILNNSGNFMRQKLIQLQEELNSLSVLKTSAPLSEMGRSIRQKLSKDIIELKTPSINWT